MGLIRAKGTRQQMPLIRPGDDPATRAPELRDPAIRDPIEVLKQWPVSAEPGPAVPRPTAPPSSRPTLRAPSSGPHLDEKIRLAHLALDLYRELEDGQLAAPVAPPVARSHVGGCQDPVCQAQANALRGALVEACLLVQRMALISPLHQRDEVEDRLRDLLALIDH